MKTHTENGQALRAGNLTGMDAQSTQESLASLRESLTLDVQAIAGALPQLDIKVNPKVGENGQQTFESRVMRDGSETQGRALFVLSFASPFSAGRAVVEGNSSTIRAALAPFLADPAIAETVRTAKRNALNVKRAHAVAVLAKIDREIATLS